MEARRCDHCGELYEPRTKRSRFCGAACRMAASRRRAQGLPESVATVTSIVTPPADESPVGPAGEELVQPPSLYAQTLVELRDAEREHTSDGVAALIAAQRIDSGASGSAYQALFRSWLTAKQAALAHASPRGGDIVDELAARRAGGA